MECFSMKHEIRQNHAEHENGNCSSQNRAEHKIRQNHAEHENWNVVPKIVLNMKLGKIMLNTKIETVVPKIVLNTKMGTVVPKIVLNTKLGKIVLNKN